MVDWLRLDWAGLKGKTRDWSGVGIERTNRWASSVKRWQRGEMVPGRWNKEIEREMNG